MWLLSTDNFSRASAELDGLLEIIHDLVERLAETGRWRVNPVGRLDLLPAPVANRLKEVGEATAAIDGITVNLAIGYGGRQEITDAVRSLLAEHAERGHVARRPRRDPRRRAHQRAPLHHGPARPRLRHPDLGRAAAVGVPAVAERPQRVLLLRGLLARVPQGRLPAGPARLLHAAAPLRLLSRARSRPRRRTFTAPTGRRPRVRAPGPPGGPTVRRVDTADPGGPAMERSLLRGRPGPASVRGRTGTSTGHDQGAVRARAGDRP